MKNLLVFVFIMFSTVAYSQELRIKWADYQGRQFEISAPSGSLSYGILQGDHISRDFNGRVNQVGSTYISYDYNGKVSQVGSVYITYDYNGRVSKVGGLYIKYDYNGNITGTIGTVN